MGTLHADRYTFMIISRSVILGMRNVSEKSYRENQKKHFMFYNLKKKSHYEITWKNIAEAGRPQMTIWRMRIACWVLKAKNTHSEYAILIAFPLQQWLHEGASLLRHYPLCLSCSLMCTPEIERVQSKIARFADSYRAVNTLRLGYTVKSVNVV